MYYFTMANRVYCKDCLIVFVELVVTLKDRHPFPISLSSGGKVT
jgi:hypothetical protein